MKHIAILCFAFLCMGMTQGQTVNYRYGASNFTVDIKSGENWTVVFYDQRHYILNGTASASFVGWVRAKPNSYSLFTHSGKPLASDLSMLIGNTLIANGFRADALTVPFNTNYDQVKRLVVNQKSSDKILLFTLNEWRTHKDAALELHYDIILSILDSKGKELATKQIADLDILGRNRAPERANLPTAVSDIFGTLLNAKEILAALKPAPGKEKMNTEVVSMTERKSVDVVVQPLPEEPLLPMRSVDEDPSSKVNRRPDRCTTRNILDMKRIGMTDEQVLIECPD